MRRVLGLPLLAAGVAILSLGLLAVAGVGAWLGLNENQRALAASIVGDHPLLGLVVLAAAVGPGILLAVVLRPYLAIPQRMAEETRVIAAANPAHRVIPAGPAGLRELAQAINSLAAGFQSSRDDVEARIETAKAGSEDEKSRLAALMAQLTQSVIVCNVEGEILLYNNSARQLLSPSTRPGGPGPIGLGRSIYAFIERNLIHHALENVRQRLRQGSPDPVTSFVTTSRAGQLIRAQLGPVAGIGPAPARTGSDATPEADVTGFVLTLEDVTQSVEAANRVAALVQSLTGGSRAALANVRAAAETMLTYPDMAAEQQRKFIGIINEEADALSARLDRTAAEYAESQPRTPLEDMLAADLIGAAQRRIESKLGVPARAETVAQPIWISVDSYALVQALTYLASRLKYELEIREVVLRLTQAGRFAHLDLAWTGEPVAADTVRTWESQPLRMGGEASPHSLHAIMERHGGEMWQQSDPQSKRTYFRLLIPLAQAVERAAGGEGAGADHYDLDLFRAPRAMPELDRRELAELTCTAFHLRTTGASVDDGNGIVALGAVRIVNGRLLRHEVFEELIDAPPAPAQHDGTEPSLRPGQSAIERALPAFHRFCADTVLVAHEADAAIRALRRHEVRTGTRFAHPVLDTLLLSAVAHPYLEGRTLEIVGARLGVEQVGDGSVLARAVTTGEVFLKLIPLLAEKGIATLKDAIEASRGVRGHRQP